MKVKLEEMKEEKRRQEVLCERRAQHVEATMRFQKGIKHFKINRGKNSSLKKTKFKKYLNFFNSDKNLLENALNMTMPQKRIMSADTFSRRDKPEALLHREKSTYSANIIKKSSSFDNINLLTSFNQFSTNNKNKKEQQDSYLNNTSSVEIISLNDTNPTNFNTKKDGLSNNTEFSNMHLNLAMNNPISNKAKTISYQRPDQKTFFKVVEPSQFNYKAQEELRLANHIITNHQNEAQKQAAKLNDESFASTNLDEFDMENADSLEIDNLKAQKGEEKSTKVDFYTEEHFGGNETENNVEYERKMEDITKNFVSKTSTKEFLVNQLLNQKKTYFTPYSHKDKIEKHLNSENEKENLSEDVREVKEETRENGRNLKANDARIKSILKRSTSDSGVATLSRMNNFGSNFGIKAEKIVPKDSIELANSRIHTKTNDDSTLSLKKKSVRFAQIEAVAQASEPSSDEIRATSKDEDLAEKSNLKKF